MKRMIGLLLSVVLACFYSFTVFSADQEEEYVTVPVQSISPVTDENLDLMIKNGNVYVNAEMLARRMCYRFSGNDEYISIYDTGENGLPVRITQFFYDTARVKHRLFAQMTDVYEAPFPSIRNEKGFWIPLEYSLLILNCEYWISDKWIITDMPLKNIMDYFYEIMVQADPYHFDWYEDFSLWLGDGGTERNISEERIRMLNSLLDREGSSWAPSFQSFAMDFPEYNKKYAENFSLFLCDWTNERKSPVEKVESYRELINKFEKNTEEIFSWDLFALSAQFDFLNKSESYCTLTEKMKQSMRGYLSILSGDVERYSIIQDFNNALGKEESKLFIIKEWKGIQNNTMLPADKMHRYVSVPEEIEKSDRLNVLYLQTFQDDAFWNFQRLYQRLSDNPETVCPADLYRLSQYCYIYLMSSYAARSAALDIYKTESDPQTKLILHSFIEEQVFASVDILMAQYRFAYADKTNTYGIYGFLPSDNLEYLKNYDSTELIDYIESVK